jgi:putative redox protein
VTQLDDAAFEAFVAEVARRCPLTQLFERAGVEITNTWTNRVLQRA